MKIRMRARQISAAAEKKSGGKKAMEVSRRNLLSSGSTLLNLACSNNPFGAFLKGKYYFLVGDSTSGKTFLAMTCFAEALISSQFKNYRLIYDNVEDGCLLDLEKLFNAEVRDRVEPPEMGEDGPVYSYLVEEFYYHVDDAIERAKKDGRPFVYVLDSMDSLTSESETDKFEQHKDAHRKGKDTPGSYGDGKAKRNSEGLRKVLKGLRDTGSILIIISQTRDNIGFGFEKKTRSGGHALKFYATVEIWSSLAGAIKKTVKGRDRQIGIHVKLKVKKNRITGESHEVQTDIYPSYGIDDIGSCIDYLVAEKWWMKKKSLIEAPEFEVTLTRQKLIAHIEENGLSRKLQRVVGECWNDVREACDIHRQGRYSTKVEEEEDE
ncbi:MAG: hypothetical protein DRN14_00100 [Thermoplasmata archaeon]|nr:MAG: hypothetical protein DRN14_00100 [Thermoplasmata archaeon]